MCSRSMELSLKQRTPKEQHKGPQQHEQVHGTPEGEAPPRCHERPLRRASSERGTASSERGTASSDRGTDCADICMPLLRRGTGNREERGEKCCSYQIKRVDSLSSFASLNTDDAAPVSGDGSSSSLSSSSLPSRTLSSSSLSNARRSLSDTLLHRHACAGGSSNGVGGHQLPRTNATFSLVQRSGSGLIRDIISGLDRKIAEGTEPDSDLSAIANCSVDPYYRVIVASSGGISSIVRAMRAFPSSESVQRAGCAALSSVCTNNATNQERAGGEGAINAIEGAMRKFPASDDLRASASDALRSLTSLSEKNARLLKEREDCEGEAGQRILLACSG